MKNLQVLLLFVSIIACSIGNDVTEDIFEPCGSGDEIEKDCARQFFAEHGCCSVVTKPDDSPIFKEKGFIYLPVVNASAADKNTNLTNLDGPIRKLYVNRATNNLVYSMMMSDVFYHTLSFTFFFHQMDKEPIILTDELYETYPHTVFTSVIPLSDGRVTKQSLLESTVTAYFLPTENVTMYIGPNITESEEPQVQAALAGVMNERYTAYREAFITEAPLRFRAYLQKYICDFGLPITM